MAALLRKQSYVQNRTKQFTEWICMWGWAHWLGKFLSWYHVLRLVNTFRHFSPNFTILVEWNTASSQLYYSINNKKKLNSMERGAFFRHFCVSKVITTAHAHKSGVIFHIFPRAFKQTKKLRLYDQRWLNSIKGLRGGGGGPALRTSNFFEKNLFWKCVKSPIWQERTR